MKRQKATEDEQTGDTPTWGCARAGTVEAWVKQVKHNGYHEEASESVSNDAVVASIGHTVGGHAHLGVSESDSLVQKRKMSWRGMAQQNLWLSAADFVLVM